MRLNYVYNFRNPVRHFINIESLDMPADITSFNPVGELSWTKPMSFRVYKADDRFRIIKMPNVLNFVRAYSYYCELPDFSCVKNLDPNHKRLDANLETGDFVSGNYNKQLNDDFVLLCNYDILIKLDISEYYGRIYTHYLDLSNQGLRDEPLAWLNNGRTSGILMGNYLSLYFAECLSTRISEQLQKSISEESIDCFFNYFSDDFYFFCNEKDAKKIVSLFDKVLGEFDFVRKEEKQLWTYETYNTYNLLTRYWKAIIRTWNLDVLKDYEQHKKHPGEPPKHRFTFLNQLIYRLSSLQDEKSKRGLITNFFKTNHFQTCDYSDYEIRPYDLHQLFFLIKSAPESLLYVSHIIYRLEDIRDDGKTKEFLRARYREALKGELHDVQLYYYYALRVLGFDDVIQEMHGLIIESQNQVLIAYYLKDEQLDDTQVDSLKLLEGEEYWFQNYHLILYSPSLRADLDNSIRKYLIPKRIQATRDLARKQARENRYLEFYRNNINNNHALINEVADVKTSITEYLNKRYLETAEEFDD